MERSALIKDRLFECIHNCEIGNEDLVEIVEHLFKILNLQTISDYARDNNLSYNGAKLRKSIILGNVKFIIDNF